MIPVVISGGSGTRLWPVSRTSFPKQFVDLIGGSLIESTYKRLLPLGSPWTITLGSMKLLTERVLGGLDIPKSQVLYEPSGKNTAPAIALLTSFFSMTGKKDEVVGIFPADHLVRDTEKFLEAVKLAASCAENGKVATLGIAPSFPSTGFGYIEVTPQEFKREHGHKAFVTEGFREKPNFELAVQFLKEGTYFWNAGIFIFKVSEMAKHFEKFMPDLWTQIQKLKPDLSNLAEIYSQLKSESIDYGVMEELEEQVCIPCDFGWSDVGSWDEVSRVRPTASNVLEEKAKNNFVYGLDEKTYTFLGVDDLIVVDTADVLMVVRKGETQNVKHLLEKAKDKNNSLAGDHVFEYRPWGYFEVLKDTKDFKSKILRVEPGHQLSYQSHAKRAEHWIIIKGSPEITLDGKILKPKPGESVFIPLGAKHRIKNPGVVPVEIVEIQVGSYFGEDDIVRYSDDYGR